ncbi:unnamed protein product [Cylindrotheca closterium]|uniref:Uncharacterized protein n=1 Tax=Cylindrotheca closterium TaxID=2856 RepID=A0AAD2FMU7_9STRA|nr:unnamed protein product [Cylindrotheca closterium]
MMLIDGASRLSLTTRKRGPMKALGSSNSSNSSNTTSNKSRRRLLLSRQQKKHKRLKKSVRFDLTHKTRARSFQKVSQEEAEHIWHSSYDYSFFVLNWKYYPHEPMEPRSFLDMLWQTNNTPETMRMEDYQCFQPKEQPKRQKIRDSLLNTYYENFGSGTEMARLSTSITAEHKRQAQVCAALNEQEIQTYLYGSTRDELMESKDNNNIKSGDPQQQQQQDAMTFVSQYVDSIIHRTAALWPTQ